MDGCLLTEDHDSSTDELQKKKDYTCWPQASITLFKPPSTPPTGTGLLRLPRRQGGDTEGRHEPWTTRHAAGKCSRYARISQLSEVIQRWYVIMSRLQVTALHKCKAVITGQSAGADGVGLQLLAYNGTNPDGPLYRGAVLESGAMDDPTPIPPSDYPPWQTFYDRLVNETGYDDLLTAILIHTNGGPPGSGIEWSRSVAIASAAVRKCVVFSMAQSIAKFASVWMCKAHL